MKKLLIGLLALIPFLKSVAQSAGNDTTQYIYYRYTYGNALDRYWAKKVLLIPGDTIYSKDGIALKAGILYLGDGTKWNQVTGGGGGADSAIATFYGLYKDFSGTTINLRVDSFAVQSRQRGLKIADSLRSIIDSTRSRINADLFTKKDKADSTGSTSYVPRNQIDTFKTTVDSSRTATWLGLASKMNNYGSAPGSVEFNFASIPSATGYPTGTTLIVPDSGQHYVDTGSGGTRGWKRIIGGSGGGGSGVDSGLAVLGPYPTLKVIRAANTVYLGADSLLNKFHSDLGRLPPIRQLYPGQGIAASGTTVTNYPISAVDSSYFPFTTLNYFSGGGTKYGGVLWNSGGGDSALLTAPFGIFVGSSFCEGHRDRHGRLHPNGTSAYQWNYPDSTGQLTWWMRQLTNYRWYNQAVGGWTSSQTRAVWARDVLAQTVSATVDGRAAQTITRKPYIVIYDGIGNDPYGVGMTVQKSIENLIYFASSCYDNNIRLIICNSPAGAGPSAAGKAWLETVNKFLESGYLDQYGVVVYDLKRFWSKPGVADGQNGVICNPAYVNNIDFTHFTQAGYDSLAIDMYNKCKIPKLTKVIISSQIDAGNPIANFNYPNAMTIDGTAYTLTNMVDSITITNPLGQDSRFVYDAGDSVWFKFTGLAHVSGNSTTYGFGHADWVLDNTNNYSDADYYTRKTMGSNGATATYGNSFTNITITPENNILTQPSLLIRQNDGTGSSLSVLPTGSGVNLIVNAGTNTARLNNALMSIYGPSSGISLSGQGSLYMTGSASNKLGLMEIGGNALPNTFGNGIGVISSKLYFQSGSGGSSGVSSFTFNDYSTFTPTLTPTFKELGLFESSSGWGIMGDGDTAHGWFYHPIYNQTAVISPGSVGFLHYQPTYTSLRNTFANGIWVERGENAFNSNPIDAGGVTIGSAPYNRTATAALDVQDTTRGIGLPRMTTTQRNHIGYVSSVTITQGTGYTNPSISFSGGTGFGVRYWIQGSGASLTCGPLDKGRGYDPSTPPTVTITGTAGSGATAVANMHGTDIGMMIYNTTTNTPQIYTNSGWQDMVGAGGSSFYQTVQSNTTSQTQRAKLNFSSAFTVTDNSGNGSTDIDINQSPVNLYDLGSGRSQQRVNAAGDSAYIRTVKINGRLPDTASDGTILITTGPAYVGTADAAQVTNTTSPGTLIGTGTGSLSFAANYFSAGNVVKIRSEGIVSTDAINPNINIGGSLFGTATGVLNWTTAGLTNAYWWIELTGVVRTAGSSGSIYWTAKTVLNGIETDYDIGANTLNTTTTQSISSFAATWTTASTNNKITGKTFIVKVE